MRGAAGTRQSPLRGLSSLGSEEPWGKCESDLGPADGSSYTCGVRGEEDEGTAWRRENVSLTVKLKL